MKIGNFTLLHRMTTKEIRQARIFARDMIGFQQQVVSADDAQLAKISTEAINRTDEQDEYVFNILSRCLAVTREEYEMMEYVEAAMLFNDLFKESSTIPFESSSLSKR